MNVQEQIQKTENKKKEVLNLRKQISYLKISNSNLTIGVPINKIDVRQRKFSDETNSVSISLSDTRSSSASIRFIRVKSMDFCKIFISNFFSETFVQEITYTIDF